MTWEERRQADRLDLKFPLKLIYRKKKFKASCRDISGKGIGISVKQPFNPSDKLEVVIPKGVLGPKPFNAVCKVAWLKEGKKGEFLAGLCFIKIDDNKKFTELLCEKLLSLSLNC